MSISDYLRSRHISFETLLHQPTPSATKLAQSVHVSGRHVAKAVLIRADHRYVLAVLPATHRIDLPRLAFVLDCPKLRLATEDEVEHVFNDCERGALPPFGRLYGLKTVVDASLAGGSEIVIEGNLRHQGVKMRYRDYEAIEAPLRARFATEIAPRRRRTSHRRAG
jgi:Ala-tRNA(Pro) deacylase